MNIAKPPGGFSIKLTSDVEAAVADLMETVPDWRRHWQAIRARLKASGHLAGTPVDGKKGSRWGVFQPEPNGPRFRIAWKVLGDTVTVFRGEF